MIASLKSVRTNPAQQTLHTRFLAIAPRIELHGRIFFRHVKCPHKRADFIADMIALSWKWFLQMAQRGKDASCFPTALACYAARAVKSGRRVHGMEQTRDVLSPLAQQRRHFLVSSLPDFQTLSTNPFAEALTDNDIACITAPSDPDVAAAPMDSARLKGRPWLLRPILR